MFVSIVLYYRSIHFGSAVYWLSDYNSFQSQFNFQFLAQCVLINQIYKYCLMMIALTNMLSYSFLKLSFFMGTGKKLIKKKKFRIKERLFCSLLQCVYNLLRFNRKWQMFHDPESKNFSLSQIWTWISFVFFFCRVKSKSEPAFGPALIQNLRIAFYFLNHWHFNMADWIFKTQ